MEDKINIESEWNSISDNNLRDTIVIKYCRDDESTQGEDLDEIITEKHAVLLEGENSECRIHLKVLPTWALRGFTIITECPKMELFFGNQQEYVKTYFGDILDDFEGIRVYRFDVIVSQPKVTYITIKLIPGVTQLWIYGLMVFLKPNPLESLFSPKINLQNVQDILSNSSHKLSPSAEKCKEFLQTYMSNRSNTSSPSIQSLMSIVNANFGQNLSLKENEASNPGVGDNTAEAASVAYSNMAEIKQHIDRKFLEVENNLTEKLRIVEQQQNDRFDKALNSLEERVFQRLAEIEKNQQEKLDQLLKLMENNTIT